MGVSQGSVATHLRCGGISYYHFAAKSVAERIFENRSTFGEVTDKSKLA